MKNLRRYDKNEISAVSKVIKEGKYLSGFTTKFHGGEEVQKFEKEFAKYIGTKYALTFNSGTSALYVAISSIIEYGKKNRKIKTNPDVHIPAYTFTADASATLQSGGKIIFEDVDEKTFCMLPPNKKSSISIPTHLLGNCSSSMNYDNTNFLIEDCCQALGTTLRGKKVGSFGDFSVFSFQETKHITTLGEGGMICSNNEELIDIAAHIRNHAEYYSSKPYLGYNYRMTESQAAFGRVQLKKLPKILKMLRSNAKLVMKKLPNGIEFPYISKHVMHSFLIIGCTYNQNIVGVSREKFLEKLTKNRKYILQQDEKSDIKGINMKSGKLISKGYAVPLYDIPAYKKFKPKGGCSNVEKIISKSLWMDIHRFRSKNEISEEMDILNETVKEFQK